MVAGSQSRFAALGIVLLVAGCSKTQPDRGSAASSSDGGLPSVARYDDEVALDHRPLVATGYTIALAAVPKGSTRAVLNKGDAVVAIATRGGFFLVSDETSKVLGWAAHFAFETRQEATGKSAPIPKCAAPSVLVSETRSIVPSCGAECTGTRDCGAHAACEAAIVLDLNGNVTLPEMYTSTCRR